MGFTPQEEQEARSILRYLDDERAKETAMTKVAESAARIHKLMAALFAAAAILVTGTWRLFVESQRITDNARELSVLRTMIMENKSDLRRHDEKIGDINMAIWKLNNPPAPKPTP